MRPVRKYHKTIPSPTAVNRSLVVGSMGRTCLQSESFSNALFTQFTKATFSSSVSGERCGYGGECTIYSICTYGKYLYTLANQRRSDMWLHRPGRVVVLMDCSRHRDRCGSVCLIWMISASFVMLATDVSRQTEVDILGVFSASETSRDSHLSRSAVCLSWTALKFLLRHRCPPSCWWLSWRS